MSPSTLRCIANATAAFAVAFCVAILDAQEVTPRGSSADFSHPPLMYSGENLGPLYLPRVAENATDSPGFRTAQRTTEIPTRLPNTDLLAPQEFYDPPSAADDFPYTGPKLSSHKNGFFQKLSFTETWLDRGHADDYGVHEMELFATVALPAPTNEWPLLITPYFNVRFLDGPNSPDLPARLYEAYTEFMWVPRISERLILIAAVAPSVYSDFASSDEGFRLTGKGLFRWDVVPDELQLMAGVLYLNRDDIRLLPAGGLIWTPNPSTRYEIFFPRPKLGHRIAFGEYWEDWLYVAGEFGGNSFSIERANGNPDKVTLRDWRVMVGLERKMNGGAGFRLEIGYVFSRTIEYASGTPDVNPDPTALIRAGIVF